MPSLTGRSSKQLGIAIISFMLAAACSEQSILASRYLTSKSINASAGGTITVTAAQSATYAGTTIVIPPGALPADQTITIAAGDIEIHPGSTAIGPVVVLGPANIAFQLPVAVTIPVFIDDTQTSALEIGYIAASGATGNLAASIADTSSPGARHDKEPAPPFANGFATFSVDQLGSFGSYYVGDISACALACPADCAAPGSLCFSDGSSYCNACIAACSGALPVTCADGGSGSCSTNADCPSGVNCIEGLCSPVGECLAACGIGCAAPGAICYEDGNDYCTPCTALCLNVTTVPCGDGGVDGGEFDGGSFDGGASCNVNADCGSGQECVTLCDPNGNCSGFCEADGIDGGGFADGGSGDVDGGDFDGGEFDGGFFGDGGPGGCDSAGECPFGQTCVEGICNYDQDGGSAPGTNSFVGAVDGAAMSSIGSSVGMNVSSPAGGDCNPSSSTELIVMLSNSAGICTAEQNGNGLPDSAVLTLSITNPGAQPVTPGTYTIVDAELDPTHAAFTTSDSGCNLVVVDEATGSITVTSINGGNAVGTFDLTFSAGDHVTGSFDTSTCTVGPSGPCPSSNSNQCAGN